MKLTSTTAPVTLTAGAAYAPKQQVISRWYDSGAMAQAGVYDHATDKKVAALDLGAEDYVTRPLYMQEVFASLRAALPHRGVSEAT